MIDQMLCPKCGEINLQSIRYCTDCGKSLHDGGKWWRTLALRWLSNGLLGGVTLFSITLLEININFYFDFNPVPKPPTPVEVKYDWYSPNLDFGDGKASVLLYLLTDEYKWELGWYDRLNKRYDKLPLSTEMVSLINNARKVICVGASSGEIRQGVNFQEGRIIEEKRAKARAETIAMWIREKMFNPVEVLKLNAGHWMQPTVESNTDHQRRVIIVLVLRIYGTWNKDKALRKAFEEASGEQPVYGVILSQYSLTRWEKFVWGE